jgi:GNAT superfamily N-acetyltransferase
MQDIHPATEPADLEAVATLLRAYAEELGMDGPDAPGVLAEADDLPGAYGPPNGVLLLARLAGEPAGVVALHEIADGVAEMKRLFVATAWRGHGLGRTLVERSVEQARARGYTTLRCDTLASMPASLALFPACGFRKIERYWDHPNEAAVFFELAL